MSILTVLYTIFIGPLQLIFEMIFAVANRIIGHPGLAIIALSLLMNFLVLPLYKRADAMQEAARDMDMKLQDGVSHIKKVFKGDERMMILQTYYQQNNYKPTDALNGSVSLLLEIPFFIAAYQFLSNLQILNGVSLGPISDLGVQDGLLLIGNISVNILPILMTLVNILSSALYLKGFPLKTKIQLYSMAVFFLIFLYNSPAGLVFYWTLNNLFSLTKNIFYKLENPKKILSVIFSILGWGVICLTIWNWNNITVKRSCFFFVIGLAMQLPIVCRMFESHYNRNTSDKKMIFDKRVFFLSEIFFVALVGVFIPSGVIAASPMEFIDVTYYHNPIWYIVNSASMAVGIFFVWMGVFYWLADNKGKAIFDNLVWIMSGIFFINYMFFGTDLGIIFANLQFENGLDFGIKDSLLNILILGFVAILMWFVKNKTRLKVETILLTAIIAITCMSGINIRNISKEAKQLKVQINNQSEEMPHFNLSKNGKNVIVFMLDRAMNQYVPYIMDEKPELLEKFSGFTYYSNTISHGGYTNFTTPALFGGYEYTPAEINKRDEESLVSKQNEALKVMPAIFLNNNYEVTVCDPPYAGYQFVPDLSIYDDMPEVQTYITQGKFSDLETKEHEIKNNNRNFFCYSIMKVMPVVMQETLYNEGNYNQADSANGDIYSVQTMVNKDIANGLYSDFMEQYNVLVNLSNMTKIMDKEINTFMMISNCTTHEPMLLQKPAYEPSVHVDNTNIEDETEYNVNGVEMKMDNSEQIIHYHANMATFLKLGEWFDYMRENDVYDNTRIILVADHGRPLNQFEDLILDDGSNIMADVEFFYPLLMVKDFGSTGFVTSEEFMTNADVPNIAMKDIIDNPINPYTGKKITGEEKTTSYQYIIASQDWNTLNNNSNTFTSSQWYRFEGNVWSKDSWELLESETTLPEEVIDSD